MEDWGFVSIAVGGGIWESYVWALTQRDLVGQIEPAGPVISLVAAWRCDVGPAPRRSFSNFCVEVLMPRHICGCCGARGGVASIRLRLPNCLMTARSRVVHVNGACCPSTHPNPVSPHCLAQHLTANASHCYNLITRVFHRQDACRHSQLLWRGAPEGKPGITEER